MTASRFESLTGAVDTAFPYYDTPAPEPLTVLRDWLDLAERHQVREPRALILTTVDAAGRPFGRTVAVTAVDERGLAFASHSTSRKGRQLAENPWASGVLYWRETGQQVAVTGRVSIMSAEECDAIWERRPAPLQPMSVMSHQSDPLADPEELRRTAAALSGREFARPERFVGYRIGLDIVEFWCAAADRMHRRLRYERTDGAWTWERLQP